MDNSNNRDLDELALIYEHFVKENGNTDVLASIFRGCLSEDTSFDNGIKIGIVIGSILAALRYWIDHNQDNVKYTQIVENVKDNLITTRTFDSAIDALNTLADNYIAV